MEKSLGFFPTYCLLATQFLEYAACAICHSVSSEAKGGFNCNQKKKTMAMKLGCSFRCLGTVR